MDWEVASEAPLQGAPPSARTAPPVGPTGRPYITITPNPPAAGPGPGGGNGNQWEIASEAPRVSTGDAITAAAAQGLTAGFSDEMAGIDRAGRATLPNWIAQFPLPNGATVGDLVSPAVGLARLGYENVAPALGVNGGDTATKAYQQGRDEMRGFLKAAQEQHQIAYPLAEAGGTLATLPALGGEGLAARGAGVLARTLDTAGAGATYGAISGFGHGEGAEGSLKEATNEAAAGGIGGMVATPVLEGGVALTRAVTAPFRGAGGAEAEAARRAGNVLSAENPGVAPPDALRRSADVVEQANAAGVPLTLADTGGEPTRAVARSAANTSTQGRQELQAATGPRFQEQGERLKDVVRSLVGGAPDAADTRFALDAARRGASGTRYRAAYAAGDRPLWSPEIERLTASPDVISAIKSAVETGKSRAVAEGYGSFNPAVRVTADGRLEWGAKGSKALPYPNLQFWDYVKRDLDDMARNAGRGTDRARYLGDLSRQLRADLDRMVPEYGQARATFAAFKGAEGALEAGENFVTADMGRGEAARLLASMSPGEQQLFREGFASELIRQIDRVPLKDRSTVASRAFLNSPAAKNRIETALGPNGARRIEAAIRLENIMEGTRRAVEGNSSTARQLAEMGFASGTGYAILTGDHDPRDVTIAGITGALLRYGKGRINENVARRVAKLLSSRDPDQIRQAADMISRSPRFADAVRRTDAAVSRAFALHAPDTVGKISAAANEPDQKQNGGPGGASRP